MFEFSSVPGVGSGLSSQCPGPVQALQRTKQLDECGVLSTRAVPEEIEDLETS